MSQHSSTPEQFFSCSEGEQSKTGPGLAADLQRRAQQGAISRQQQRTTATSLPTRQNMTSDEDATRIARLPVEPSLADEEKVPLIRGTSRAVTKVRTTRWRWLMLLIFTLNMAVSAGVLSTFMASESVLEYYYVGYNSGWKSWVKHLTVYETVVKALLLLPSAWMLVRYELKFTVVCASFATALGTTLRLVGASSEYFAALITGQLVTTFSSLMFVSVTFFSEVWFSQTERALSTAVSAVVGPKLGEVVSYVLGPLVLLKSDRLSEICTSEGLCGEYFSSWRYYLLGQILVASLLFLVTVAVFRMAPRNPPSLSRKLEISARCDDITFCEQLKAFLTSFLELGRNYFLFFLIPAGVIIGASGSLLPQLSQIHTHKDQEISYLEITGAACSIGASVLTAIVINYTKLFYQLGLILYCGVVLSVTAFATIVYLSTKSSIHAVGFYVTVGLVGASVSSFQVLGLEYSVEMTYPIPEGTSAAVFYFIGTILLLVMRVLFNEISSDKVYILVWVITGLTIIGFMLLVLVRPDQKRRKLEHKKRLTHCPEPPCSL